MALPSGLPTLADVILLVTALYLGKGSEAGYSATSIVMLSIGLMIFSALLFLKKGGCSSAGRSSPSSLLP